MKVFFTHFLGKVFENQIFASTFWTCRWRHVSLTKLKTIFTSCNIHLYLIIYVLSIFLLRACLRRLGQHDQNALLCCWVKKKSNEIYSCKHSFIRPMSRRTNSYTEANRTNLHSMNAKRRDFFLHLIVGINAPWPAAIVLQQWATPDIRCKICYTQKHKRVNQMKVEPVNVRAHILRR